LWFSNLTQYIHRLKFKQPVPQGIIPGKKLTVNIYFTQYENKTVHGKLISVQNVE